MHRKKLISLLRAYQRHSGKTIDGLMDVFKAIDVSVDNTAHVIQWASIEMESISQASYFDWIKVLLIADTSTMTDMISTTVTNKPAKETRVRNLFICMIDQIQKQISETLGEYSSLLTRTLKSEKRAQHRGSMARGQLYQR